MVEVNKNNKEEINMKMIHITHNDLDGVGCSVLGELFAESQGLEYEVHNVRIGHQDNMIQSRFSINSSTDINKLADIAYILVSDLPISEKSAELLNKIYEEANIRVQWVEHHKSNIKLGSRYPEWAYIKPIDNKGTPLTSTMLLYRLWNDTITYDNNIRRKLLSFSNIVSRYHTGEWKTNPIDYSEEDLDILLKIIGIPHAPQLFLDMILSPDESFSINSIDSLYRDLIKDTKRQRGYAIRDAIRSARYIDFFEFKVAAIIPSQHFGTYELGALYKAPGFTGDFVLGLYPNLRSISFRSSPKSNIDLSAIAKRFGGAGHPRAASAKLTSDQFLKILGKFYESHDTLTASYH
jgi:oligoribonuclease NrnB/cAMP/cGMP phosphodiesterase (DHH superfamily)